jgi:hypothetical protein
MSALTPKRTLPDSNRMSSALCQWRTWPIIRWLH